MLYDYDNRTYSVNGEGPFSLRELIKANVTDEPEPNLHPFDLARICIMEPGQVHCVSQGTVKRLN